MRVAVLNGPDVLRTAVATLIIAFPERAELLPPSAPELDVVLVDVGDGPFQMRMALAAVDPGPLRLALGWLPLADPAPTVERLEVDGYIAIALGPEAFVDALEVQYDQHCA